MLINCVAYQDGRKLGDIAATEIRRIAREMAAAESAACYGRLGTCVQEFGTLASWGCDLVNILTGNGEEAR